MFILVNNQFFINNKKLICNKRLVRNKRVITNSVNLVNDFMLDFFKYISKYFYYHTLWL